MRGVRAGMLLVAVSIASLAPTMLAAQPVSWRRCVVGLNYGAPLKLAVSAAYGRVTESQEGGNDACNYVSARLGVGGARMSLGSTRTINALGGAAGVSVGVLRTFGSPLHAQRWRNYAGASVLLMPALVLGGELGYYVRLGTDANGAPARRVFTWSAGFGF